jgi:hypothetical protein
MVGSRSTCSQLRSSTLPSAWSGALTNTGTQASWWALAALNRRAGLPGMKPSPWSAVKMTSDLSYWPVSLSFWMTWPSSWSV